MSATLQKATWKAVGGVSGLAAAALTRKALTTGWQKTKREDPPANPASHNTAWREALLWAALTGVAVGIGRLVATRGAAGLWHRTTGKYPPGLEELG